MGGQPGVPTLLVAACEVDTLACTAWELRSYD